MPDPSPLGVVTPLRAAGYTVLPTPQQVELRGADVRLNEEWRIERIDIAGDDIAAAALIQGVRDTAGIELAADGGSHPIQLSVRAGALNPPDEQLDAARAAQAYILDIAPEAIHITGNTPQGLFFGVQTFLQLLKQDGAGRWILPHGVIRDWPAYELRICHWDTKHHQDRIETLKRYLDWCARFKVNMISLELEDKFAYPSHPQIGQPAAFTPAELQSLVDYALDRYIQIVPNIQAPAHVGYVLKHPQFAHLRSDGSNYMAKFSTPETLGLIFDMYKDVIDATQGVEYLHVSTDEVYYAGIDPADQRVRPYTPENRSLWFVEFVKAARNFSAEHGRRCFVWLEMPLLPQHVHLLPADIIDGIVGNEQYVEPQRAMGMRTLIYSSIQGAEWLFPNYFDYADPAGRTQGQVQPGRLRLAIENATSGRATRVNPIGTFAAAWDDSGLHNETFWLGWAVASAAGWHPGGASLPQAVCEFFEVYYGPGCDGLIEAYRSLQSGARLYEGGWDTVASTERGPGYGNSQGKRPINRVDHTLAVPDLPALPNLSFDEGKARWTERYASRVARALAEAERNERLRFILQAHLPKVRQNRYNLEVLLALADLQRHHIALLVGLAAMDDDLHEASAQGQTDAGRAVGLLLRAYDRVDRLVDDLHAMFSALKATWEKSMFPKNRTVDGREYLHVMDDVKDHFADRRVDIDYMIAPEQRMDLPGLRSRLAQLIRSFTQAHGLSAKGLPDQVLED